MNYFNTFVFFAVNALFFATTSVCQDAVVHNVLQDKISHPQSEQKRFSRYKNPNRTISFYFDNEDMIDIINFLASEREVNVVLPMGADALNVKVTLHLEDKISIEEAWDILYTLLDIAGYSMIAKEDTYNIVKTTKNVSREALPLYIVKPDEIPNTDKRIRYLYYFKNIKIADDQSSEIRGILNEVLPPDTAIAKLDPLSNSLLVSDKANNIKALMNIVAALDQADSQETPEIIQLRYLPADMVAKLFDDILKTSTDPNQARLGIRPPNNSTYFKKVRIVPDLRTNRLIVFGKAQAIERVRDFIHKYIDVELESGKSILHVYQLQYLDAKSFAVVLKRIVTSERAGGTEQSRAATVAGSTERYFDEVRILADQPDTISGDQPSGFSRGSNNLIIAARNEDYEHIKKLIEQLDIPQRLVIIEVLIADLTIADIASLGASIRNPLGSGLPNNVNFQSAQATDILTNTLVNPTTLQADLLRNAFDSAGNVVATCDNYNPSTAVAPCFSAAKFITGGSNFQGTALLSFNDAVTGQTWGIAQVRKFLDGRKILSHPHLIATNNKPAEIKIVEERLAIDQGSGSTGGTTTQARRWIPAPLSVIITPRISAGDIVNLTVEVNINQFETPASTFTNTGPNAANTANQISRRVVTNANVKNGQILALGGLTRVDTAIEQLETPLLAKIPIIGWFFKDRTNTTNKNNLTVFISPTIVEPRIRGGVSTYTTHHVQLAKSYSREGMLFDNLRDPITRWFFKSQRDDAATDLDDFIAQDEFTARTVFDERDERRVVASAPQLPEPISNKDTIVIIASPKMARTEIPKEQTSAATHPVNELQRLVADIDNPFNTKKSTTT